MNPLHVAAMLTCALLAGCGAVPAGGLVLELPDVQLTEGDTTPLVVEAFEHGKTFDVTQDATATISGDAVSLEAGILKALKPGQATLTATYRNRTASTTVTVVEAPLVSMTLVAEPGATFKVGTTAQLQVVGKHRGGNERPVTGTVTFQVSDPRVASVDATGLLTLKAGGPADVTAQLGDMTSVPFPLVATCDYPHYTSTLEADPIGEVMPPLSWKSARKPDGSLFHLDTADLYCNADYQDDSVFIVWICAGWCYSCALEAQNWADNADRFQAAHARIVLIEAQKDNEQYPEPSDTGYAWQHESTIVEGHGAGVPAGFVVGDAETEAPAAQPCSIDKSVTCYFNNQSKYLTQFPSVLVVRHRDMKIIAFQNYSWIPFIAIANDPEADWSPQALESNVGHCSDADALGHEPDDDPADAAATTPVPLDTPIQAGICRKGDTDVFLVDVPGDWTATIQYDSVTTDLELSLPGTGESSHETIHSHGRSQLAVTGDGSGTIGYTLTVSSP